jgi:hypothetical protein
MKAGDKFPVLVGGMEITQAEVKSVDLNGDQPTATIMIPGTLAVVAISTQLAPPPPPEKLEAGTEVIIDGVERVSSEAATEETTNVAPATQTPTEPIAQSTAEVQTPAETPTVAVEEKPAAVETTAISSDAQGRPAPVEEAVERAATE